MAKVFQFTIFDKEEGNPETNDTRVVDTFGATAEDAMAQAKIEFFSLYDDPADQEAAQADAAAAWEDMMAENCDVHAYTTTELELPWLVSITEAREHKDDVRRHF